MAIPLFASKSVTDNYHGEEVTDDFRSLEDEQHSEVAKWLAAEDSYTEQRLGQLSSAEFIRQRLTELSNYKRTSAPTEVAGHWFYLQNDGLQDQSVLYVRPSDSGAPHIVIDPNQLDPAGTTSIHDYSVSPDGKTIAYSLSEKGSDWVDWYVTSVTEPKPPTQPVISGVKFTQLAWTKDSRVLLQSLSAKQ